MAEHEQEVAIGIDLGTTNSCVAVYRRGRVEVIINEQGHNVTPSCVAFDGTDRLVGVAALNQASRNSSNTIFESKRLIGRQWTEQIVQDHIKRWPFKVVQGTGGRPEIIVQYKEAEKILKPEEVSSAILAKMREIAEAKLNTTVKNAVITVPAHFNDSQRRATRDAGVIAGLNVIRIINEPTAAALAYGLDKLQDADGRQKKHILVFDLGGGTLDVTVILMQDGVLKVKSTLGDAYLGGEDFTGRLVNYVADQFKKKHKHDISGNKRALARLRTPCENAKKVLSYQTMTEVEVDSVMDGINLRVRVSRAKLEELNMDLFENCMKILDNCVGDLRDVTKDAIDEIVLVGGSTRIPKIQEMVKEFFNNKKLNMTLHPDEAVACGAAILAANPRPADYETSNSIVLVDVIPLSLGIELQGGLMEVQIKRNKPIPAIKERVFKTAVDGQTTVTIKVFEGERRLTRDNHLLGEFTLEGIPMVSESAQYIHITFSVDADGILTVTAEHRSGGLKKDMVVSNKLGLLTEEEVERMVEEAERYRSEDEEKKKTAEARNELESYVSSVKHKLKYGKLGLSCGDKVDVDAALSRASDCFERDELGDSSEYEAAKNELERVLTEALDRVIHPKSMLRIPHWFGRKRLGE